MFLADFITYATTSNEALTLELSEARRQYWIERNNPQQAEEERRLRACTASRTAITFCRDYIRTNRRTPSEEVVTRFCLRNNLRPSNELRELRRFRLILN